MGLPAQNELNDNTNTEGDEKTLFEDQRDAIAAIPGVGVVVNQITVASGAITPADGASLLMDVRGEGGADDVLASIVATNVTTGSMAILFAGNPGTEDITIDHGTGSPAINLVDGVDFVLDAAGMYLAVRYDGTDWQEVWRSWGDNSPTKAAFRTHHGLGDVVTLNAGTSPSNVPQVSDILGKKFLYFPVRSMSDPLTNPAGAEDITESSSNPEIRPLRVKRLFENTNDKHLQWSFGVPDDWDLGTITFKFYHSHAGGQTGGQDTVQYGLRGSVVANSATFNADMGTEVLVQDDGPTASEVYESPESANVTLANAAATGLINLRVSRKASGGTDDFDGSNHGLHGVGIYYTTNQLNDD